MDVVVDWFPTAGECSSLLSHAEKELISTIHAQSLVCFDGSMYYIYCLPVSMVSSVSLLRRYLQFLFSMMTKTQS